MRILPAGPRSNGGFLRICKGSIADGSPFCVAGASSKNSANIPSCFGGWGEDLKGSDCGLPPLIGGEAGKSVGGWGLDSRDLAGR